MTINIKLSCSTWYDASSTETKRWVVFSSMDIAERRMSDTETTIRDDRLRVQLFAQSKGEVQECLKEFTNITRVDFIRQANHFYAIDLHDETGKITDNYLNSQPKAGFDEKKFDCSKKVLTEDSWEWEKYLNWTFKETENGYTASIQRLPHEKFISSSVNPYICL